MEGGRRSGVRVFYGLSDRALSYRLRCASILFDVSVSRPLVLLSSSRKRTACCADIESRERIRKLRAFDDEITFMTGGLYDASGVTRKRHLAGIGTTR